MGKDPDEIRREIEGTRSRMTETVGAITSKADVKARTKESLTNTKERVVDSMSSAKESVVEAIAGAKDSAADAAGSVGDAVSTAGATVTDSVSSAKDAVASTVSDVTPDAEQLGAGAQRTVGIAQENPLGLAIGSVALGFLFGMLVPTSRVETERLAPVAEKVKETGQDALRRGVQKAEEAVQETASSAAASAVESVTHGVAERAQEKLS